ncbi:hypothetical protein GLAREA_04358 [Glarea lozoyensis ATCC 20868]|uniref:Uncharacterized protein n=1 Tax=Glarea lozoyensis (strain ATCC 20868 / MF5171) TaxID=1116229 RepID=S3CM28_GLAL2|nr:uncharacterized protein GLAREA_04358 [Glarea lozoyensis ATCC 20868]EPE27567.1 hypothetical protein GLAREA_04358 [Glarea lozoyensis ATCC 20868]
MGASLTLLSHQIHRDEYTLLLINQRITYYETLLPGNTYPFKPTEVQRKITRLQRRRARMLYVLDKNTVQYHEIKDTRGRKKREKQENEWKKAEEKDDWYALGKLRVKELARRNAEGRMGGGSDGRGLPVYTG